eukprot:638929-Rhodomonas_salina.1
MGTTILRPFKLRTIYPSVDHNYDDGPARHQLSTHLSMTTTTTALPCTNRLPICQPLQQQLPGPAPTIYPSVYHYDNDCPACTNCLPICLRLPRRRPCPAWHQPIWFTIKSAAVAIWLRRGRFQYGILYSSSKVGLELVSDASLTIKDPEERADETVQVHHLRTLTLPELLHISQQLQVICNQSLWCHPGQTKHLENFKLYNGKGFPLDFPTLMNNWACPICSICKGARQYR